MSYTVGIISDLVPTYDLNCILYYHITMIHHAKHTSTVMITALSHLTTPSITMTTSFISLYTTLSTWMLLV